jgi:very-short-patch-repair endonuclease
LRRRGWRVLRLWECEIEKRPEKTMERIRRFIENS